MFYFSLNIRILIMSSRHLFFLLIGQIQTFKTFCMGGGVGGGGEVEDYNTVMQGKVECFILP